MASVFSLLFIVVLGGFVWWGVSKNAEGVPKAVQEQPKSIIIEPIKEAERAKQQLESKTSLSAADFSGQGLGTVPTGLFERTELEQLNLSHNALEGSLPAEVRHLVKLKVLNLSNNLFTGVPAEIGQLQNLETLDLSNNKLTGLPHELGNLSRLQILNLSGNTYSKEDLVKIKESLPFSTKVITE